METGKLPMNGKELVSVIIPTRNSEKTLPICLASVRNQTYRNVEVIVVDNFSSDRTVEIAKDYGAKVYIKGYERSFQKNYGAMKAHGKYLYFIDADFYLHPKLIEEAINKMKEGYDALIVLNISDPRPSLWAKVRHYERLSYYGSGIYEAARFMRKEIFLKAGGFDTKLYANEDYDLHERLLKMGVKIGRTRYFEIHLGEPKSLREVVVKNYYYGKSLAKYFTKNPKVAHLSPVRRTFLRPEIIKLLSLNSFYIIYLIIFLKFVQSVAAFLGLLFRKSLTPYVSYSRE